MDSEVICRHQTSREIQKNLHFVLNLAMQDSLILAIQEAEQRLSELREEKESYNYTFNPQESEVDQNLLDSIAQVEEWANEEPSEDRM